MRNQKVIMVMGLAICVVMTLMAAPAGAATEAEKRAAIDAGIDYLLSTQNPNGSWAGQSGFFDVGTGLAVLALAEDDLDRQAAGLPETPRYTAIRAAIKSGMDYMLGSVNVPTITSVGQAGDPDVNGNGTGLRWAPGGSEMYVTGFALPGVVKAAQALGIAKTDTVTVAGSPVNGWTMGDVVQDVVDYMAYGQTESGIGRGGWRYGANAGADNSVSQFPTLAMVYGADYGATVPDFVKTELAFWANTVQRGDGGSGYTSGTDGYVGEILGRTGGLLLQNLVVESAASSPDRSAQQNAAMAFLNTYWKSNNLGSFYSMWGAYKGLEAELGIFNKGSISNLYYDTVANAWGAGNFDNPFNNQWNWWEDYCEWLVNTQQTGAFAGSRWNASGRLTDYNTDTAIAVSILKGIPVPAGGDVVPEPITMFGVIAGLGMLGGYVRKRRRA